MKFVYFSLLFIVSLIACSNENNDFTLTFEAQPSFGNAPLDCRFLLSAKDRDLSECKTVWDFGDGESAALKGSASHWYKKAGDYTVTVKIDCDGQKSSAKSKVRISPSADLEVSSVRVEPLRLNTSSELKIEYRLSNKGHATENAFRIAYYLTPTANPALFVRENAIKIGYENLRSFPGSGKDGSTVQKEKTLVVPKNTPSSVYHVAVSADDQGDVGEFSEENNLSFTKQTLTVFNQTTDGPDFVAQSFVPGATEVLKLVSFTATAEIANRGSSYLGKVPYEILIRKRGNEEEPKVMATGEFNALSAGESLRLNDMIVSMTETIEEEGSYDFFLHINREKRVEERDFDNNLIQSTHPIKVTKAAVPKADIFIESIGFSPSVAAIDTYFRVETEIGNLGSQETGSFICTVYLSEDGILDLSADHAVGTLNVDGLEAYEKKTFADSVSLSGDIKKGNYHVCLFCDSSGVVAEENETNNTRRSENLLKIGGESDIDLRFGDSAIFVSNQVNEGDEVTIEFRVCNFGKTSAPPAAIRSIFIRRCSGEEENFAPDAYVEALAPGQCVLSRIASHVQCAKHCDTYGARLIIDPQNLIAEKHKSNNEIVVNGTLTIAGDNCSCKQDQAENNNMPGHAYALPAEGGKFTLCYGDRDWFYVDVPAHKGLDVVLRSESSAGALTLELWKDGAKIDIAEDFDVLRVSDTASGQNRRYHILVRAEAGIQNNYTLSHTADSEQEALSLSRLTIENERLTAEKESEVRYILRPASSKKIEKSFDVSFHITREKAFDAEHALKIGGRRYDGLDTAIHDSIFLKMPEDAPPGTWRLVAVADPEKVLNEAHYDDNVAVSKPWLLKYACRDMYDPNDERLSAKEIVLTEANGHLQFSAGDLIVCKQSPDYYSFFVKSHKSCVIEADNLDQGSDFDLFLYNIHGELRASARTAAATERLFVNDILGDQDFVLGIVQTNNHFNPESSRYRLRIQCKNATSALLCDDTSEPNDSLASAADLFVASKKKMSICPKTDADYYKIALKAGQTFKLRFEDTAAGVRSAIYGSNGEFLALIANTSESFRYVAPFDGIYYVKMYTNQSSIDALDYTMVLDSPQPALSLENLRPAATQLVAGHPISLYFDVRNRTDDAKDAIKIRLKISPDIVEEKDLGSTLAPKALVSSYFKVMKSLPPGKYKAQVTLSHQGHAVDGATTSFEVTPACEADDYEVNESFAQASEADIRKGIGASLCPYDKDYYKVTVGKGGAVLLEFAQGDADIYAFALDRKVLAAGTGLGQTERLDIPADSEIYLLIVSANPEQSLRYTLSSP